LRRFDTLLQALAENRADAVIASLAVTPETRQRVDFSDPYYRPTARFVARRDTTLKDVVPEGRRARDRGRRRHRARAISQTFFHRGGAQAFSKHGGGAHRAAQGRGDLLFGDGVALAFWLNGTDSAGCCGFVGGPYTESRYSAKASASQ